MNLPNTNVSLPAFDRKDIEDAKFKLKMSLTGLHFHICSSCLIDIIDLKKLIQAHSDFKIPPLQKIEKPEGVKY